MSTKRFERVVVFAGGSGAQALIHHLAFELSLPVTVVVNAYDDGKSTGVLRDLIPGMLGPSDIRKNIANLIPEDHGEGSACKRILDYRFPQHLQDSEIKTALRLFIQNPESEKYYGFKQLFSQLAPQKQARIGEAIEAFLDWFEKQKTDQKSLLADMALGNILIAGLYLLKDRNFNEAIDGMHRLFPLRGRVLNVNDGANRVLVGLREDGFLAARESEIVNDHSEFAYQEIFLLEESLANSELHRLRSLGKEALQDQLRQIHCPTRLNPVVAEHLRTADLILAGPGTPFSSLYPTYLTEGLGDLLEKEVKVPKVLLTNIGEDFDTSKMTARFLFEKATQHFKLAESPFTHCFVNVPNGQGSKGKGLHSWIQPGSFDNIKERGIKVLLGDWEDKVNPGKHDCSKVAAALAKILWQPGHLPNPFGFRSLSIILPAYNEEKCVTPLLNKILSVDFSPLRTFTEIIFVDDGSTDRTVELVKSFQEVTLLAKPKNEGKGSAVRMGLSVSRGDFAVIHDADLEYEPQELVTLLKPMIEQGFKAVYGSRTLISSNTKRHLKFIYKKKQEQYWMAYVGNYVLSLSLFALYGKYLTDTLTAYKMYDGETIRSMDLRRNGFELDHEITTTILKRGIDILEVPVSYQPRTHEEGKKIRIRDGFIALGTIFSLRFVGKKFLPKTSERTSYDPCVYEPQKF